MSHKRGPWTVRESVEKYHNEFFTVREDQVVRPDGKPGTYAIVTLKPGVCILPVEADGTVYLVRQFRYAVERESLEAPAGSLDEGEPPLEAARRELEEEMGIRAAEWLDLGAMDLDTSIIRCALHLFVARGLSFTQAHPEGTEQLQPVRMTLEGAVEAVQRGEIRHGPSAVLILKAARALAGEEPR